MTTTHDINLTTSDASGQSTIWLPSKHEPPLLDGPLNPKYIKEHKANDWFLTLHDAMPKHSEARMMAKVYIFLRQYMPEGFTGRWAHLSGSEVMRVLLSDQAEQSVSRHKATKKIYPSLGKLEHWMKKGSSWQIALETSKMEAKDIKAHATKRSQLQRAPMPFYTPERCLAFLVLAYPDRKYRDMFQRLGLGWMMDDPKALNVQDRGFWYGLDSRTVFSVFLPAKPLPANEANCSLDYDVLFGASFPKCREDIKPYLPSEEWAQGLCLGTETADSRTAEERAADNADVPIAIPDDSSSDPGAEGDRADDQSSRGLFFVTSPTGNTIGKYTRSGDGDNNCASAATGSTKPSGALEDVSGPANTWTELGIARHLSADSKSDGALPGWVAHFLRQTHDTFTVMRTWCCFWQKRMSAAETAEEQLLTRSLILQSARIIRSFHTSSATAAADAYMLLDMGAWDRLSEDCPESRNDLGRIPQFAAYSKARDQFIESLGNANEDAAKLRGRIFSRQASFFYSTQKDPKLWRCAKDCMRLAEIRLSIFSRGLVPGSTPALLQQSRLWDDAVLSALQLSHWQALAAMHPAADLPSILSSYQFEIFNKDDRAEGRALPTKDALKKPVFSFQSYKGDCQQEDRNILTALFGALETHTQNQSAPAPASVPNAIRLAKASRQPDSPPRESEGDTQHQPVPASPEMGGRSQAQPSPTRGGSTKSNNSKKRHLFALHLKQDKNPYAPLSPSRAVGRNERSTKVPPLGGGSDTSSMGNNRNPYAKAIRSPTARPLRVIPRESVLREEVKGVREKVDLFLESQCRIREETVQLIEEKLEAKIQAVVATVESRLSSLSTLHTKTHGELIDIMNAKLASVDETLSRTIIDRLELHRNSHDASLDKLARTMTEKLGKQLVQVNQGVSTTVNEQFLKQKEVDETLVQKMEGKLDEIKGILSKVPSVGQEGYLGYHCPPPSTSEMAPVAYEHSLIRAAIYYFSLFDTDSPLAEDYVAMEDTMARYPQLEPGHIGMAIGHLHVMAYGHSMAEA
ncbi:hypothetical protein F5Y01DRAFT_322778 [Xylaria sp. FL0043]|nr:hypothetical protein F5Y01DRAFT_322778 [Xylaria sp. FL0043]